MMLNVEACRDSVAAGKEATTLKMQFLSKKLFKVKYLPNKNIKNIIIRHYQKQGQKKDDIKSR